ncbi:uracil-DNA glycosylase [candidate division LCP-89 bacterium B3_LCP]|uniref:Type-4 uracil-DNA glycosylase n=1 Tax=candidate division LCP-89 bacterium B3_LCP TaxID=2012998 RepID=A0A532V0F2_UNCL8|nr:MAG: uracil-DNA glycosylase [candidate division LCP-89 bacterium B3_LCP]
MRDKIRDYFEYLSLFESELYLDKLPEGSLDKIPQPELDTSVSPGSGGLNPYPSHAPYDSLEVMESQVKGCLRCPLGSQRNKFVFGTGSSRARVVFIGEAPGAREDLKGEPFVGRAGELLNQMLQQIGWQRSDFYICNILKCRPPNNRDPQPDEISQCEPFLHEQLRLLDPLWLVALGRVSAQVLLRTKAPLRALRGRVHNYRDKPFWIIYHPAALLRNQNLMSEAHQDLLTLKRMVESGEGLSGV